MTSLPKSLKRTVHSLRSMLSLFALSSCLLANPPAAVASAAGLGAAVVAADAAILTPIIIGSAGAAAVVVIVVGGLYYALSQKEEQKFNIVVTDPVTNTQRKLSSEQVVELLKENARLTAEGAALQKLLDIQNAARSAEQAAVQAEKDEFMKTMMLAFNNHIAAQEVKAKITAEQQEASLVRKLASFKEECITKDDIAKSLLADTEYRKKEKNYQQQQKETTQQVETLLDCVGPILFAKQNETDPSAQSSSSASSLANSSENLGVPDDLNAFVLVTPGADQKGGAAYVKPKHSN